MARSSIPIIQVTRRGLLLWIGLVVFISFWMFVLGVLVGRGMAPVNLDTGKLEQELVELKARMLKEKQEAAVSGAIGRTDEKPELGFYEALKNPGKEADFKPAKPAKPVRRKPVEAEPVAPAARPGPTATAPPSPVAMPNPKPAPAPKTDSGSKPGPTSTPGHFAVQVASVQDIKGAEKMVAELRAKGYQAYQVRSDVDGKGIWYRIRVGGFQDRRAAAGMLKKLKNDKFGGMVVSID
jgi:cell division septation protein DedD